MSADPETHYERERRFLVADKTIVSGWPHVVITQAYVWQKDGYAARVRLIQREDSSGALIDLDATYAIKGPRVGDERFEAESNLGDIDVAKAIIQRCPTTIRKKRYQVVDVETYDVDVFLDDNEGLVIAELEGSDIRGVRRPEWCSEEITTRDEYNNESLAIKPRRS